MRLTSELNLGTVKNYFNSSWNFLQDIIACNFYRDADRIYRFDDSNSPCLSAENWKIKTAQLVIDIFLLFLFLSIIPRDINLGNVKHKRTKINRLVTQRRCRRGWHCVRSKKEYRENVEHLSILFQRNNMYFFFCFLSLIQSRLQLVSSMATPTCVRLCNLTIRWTSVSQGRLLQRVLILLFRKNLAFRVWRSRVCVWIKKRTNNALSRYVSY